MAEKRDNRAEVAAMMAGTREDIPHRSQRRLSAVGVLRENLRNIGATRTAPPRSEVDLLAVYGPRYLDEWLAYGSVSRTDLTVMVSTHLAYDDLGDTNHGVINRVVPKDMIDPHDRTMVVNAEDKRSSPRRVWMTLAGFWRDREKSIWEEIARACKLKPEIAQAGDEIDPIAALDWLRRFRPELAPSILRDYAKKPSAATPQPRKRKPTNVHDDTAALAEMHWRVEGKQGRKQSRREAAFHVHKAMTDQGVKVSHVRTLMRKYAKEHGSGV
jgi:hypothetical protein